MFSSILFRKIYFPILLIIILFSVALYFFSVPLIKKTVYGTEEDAAKTILDNVYELVKSEYLDIESYRESALELHKKQLKNISLIQEAFIKSKYEKYKQGLLTEEEAKKSALEELRTFRYGPGKIDYLWVSDYDSVLISHPDPELYKADFSDVRDIRGNLIVPPMVEIALKEGEGYHSYWWRRLGEEEPIEKLTYSKNFPEWQWVFGTGVYIDDVKKAVDRRKEKMIEELRQILRGIKIARTGYMYIFNSQMFMIIHPNPNIENTNANNLIDPVTRKPIIEELIAAAQKDDPKLYYKWDKPDDSGNYIYDKISWVKYFKGFDWYIASSIYLDELNRGAVMLRNRVLGIAMIMLVMTIVAAGLVLNKVLVPIRGLSGAANRIMEGDLSVQCDVKGRDEIAVLATTFNNMVSRLKQNIDGLDKKVQERTEELEKINEQLRQEIEDRKKVEEELKAAKEKAEAASRVKTEFLSSISHEIRTPLNAILGMSDLLGETPLNDEQSKYVQMSAAAGENLLCLIDDILDISRMETGNLDLEIIHFDLSEVVERTCEIAAHQAYEKGLELSCRVLPAVPAKLIGDPVRLRQILLNLIGNAIKFTITGGVKVEVTINSKDQETGIAELKFSISDSGIGIPQEKMDLIFGSFAQADSSSTRIYGGLGLGLTISKRLVDLMGGRIWVESKLGRGSTFFFTAKLQIPSESEKEQILSRREAIPPKKERPLSILLVEDFEDNQLLIQSYLKKKPYSVEVAENGLMALEKFKNNHYDLVLMDMQMPVMDGYTATKEIRKWEKENNLKNTPIIALTAHAAAEESQKSLNAGCNIHLTKPIKKADLIQSIIKTVS